MGWNHQVDYLVLQPILFPSSCSSFGMFYLFGIACNTSGFHHRFTRDQTTVFQNEDPRLFLEMFHVRKACWIYGWGLLGSPWKKNRGPMIQFDGGMFFQMGSKKTPTPSSSLNVLTQKTPSYWSCGMSRNERRWDRSRCWCRESEGLDPTPHTVTGKWRFVALYGSYLKM